MFFLYSKVEIKKKSMLGEKKHREENYNNRVVLSDGFVPISPMRNTKGQIILWYLSSYLWRMEKDQRFQSTFNRWSNLKKNSMLDQSRTRSLSFSHSLSDRRLFWVHFVVRWSSISLSNVSIDLQMMIDRRQAEEKKTEGEMTSITRTNERCARIVLEEKSLFSLSSKIWEKE